MNEIKIDELITKHNIKVKNLKIFGIKNPLLSVEILDAPKDCEFYVLLDGQQIPFDIHILEADCFVIEAVLGEKKGTIIVALKESDQYYLLSKTRNTLFLRIANKVFSTIRKFCIKVKVLFIIIGRGIRFLWKEHHFIVPPILWKKYFLRFKTRMKANGELQWNPFIKADYTKWLNAQNKTLENSSFEYNPLISILIPVYNIGELYLSKCIESILNQTYQNFEICLVDDCSTNVETIETLKKYEKNDKRIKVCYRKENGHISRATNDALDMASGEFIGLVDNDDVLARNALYENVKALNHNRNLDFIYSDEDKLDVRGNRCDPNFKPDYSPDTLLSLNYICHFALLRTDIVKKIGGFSVGLEGAQDFDLFLRFVEQTSSDKIHHISKILYHWRMVEGSTSMTIDNKEYAMEKGKMAIENALERRNIKGYVEKDLDSTYYRVVYELDVEPSVSIIIPTKDYADVTDVCLKSVFEKTDYKNYEIILVDNKSEKEETFALFEKYKKNHDNFRVVLADMEFNYSAINNLAIAQSTADVIVLLNNDTEVISKDWLKTMVSYAVQSHIGAVGPKLLYPDLTVQHAGVFIGLGGVANHAYIGADRADLGMYGRLRVPYNFGAVTAACLGVERKKINEVHGLEENLKVAFNDMDFNLKLLDAGYYNICVPQVELIHFESKSRGLDTTSDKYKRFLYESDYMFKKWDKYIKNDPYYNSNFSLKGMFMLDKCDK